MDVGSVLNMVLVAVFIVVGIALVFFVLELIKVLKTTRETISHLDEQLSPTMANVKQITADIEPAMLKVDPIMDRVQLTLDSVNLEMMRVDKILEDVGDITDAASSATSAVDNITNAPVKAVNNVASRVKNAFGGKGASEESVQLAEQRVAVARALEDYKAAEEKQAKKAAKAEADAEAESKPQTHEEPGDVPGSYVKKFEEGCEPVIDPHIIADSHFFDEESNAAE